MTAAAEIRERAFLKFALDLRARGAIDNWAELPSGLRTEVMLAQSRRHGFHQAVQQNKRIAPELRRQVDLLFKRSKLKPEAIVKATPKSKGGKDGRQRYRITFDATRKRWMCTCADWTFRKSWLPDSAPVSKRRCKHLKALLKKKKR